MTLARTACLSLGIAAVSFTACGCMPVPVTPSEALIGIDRASFTVTPTDGPPAEVSYLRAGGDTLPRAIFIHGTPGAADNFIDFLTDPLPRFETIAIDRPGFAESGKRPWTSLADQARAIEPLLVQRDGRWPILIGHSLGGPIVARAAADYPDRVGGIVIAAGALDPGLEKVLLIQRIGNGTLVRWALPSWVKNSNSELIALERELNELEPLLASINCPIIIVHGTEDELVPYDNVEFMQQAFAGNDRVETVTIEGGNHFLPWNAEQVLRDAVTRAAQLAMPTPDPPPGS